MPRLSLHLPGAEQLPKKQSQKGGLTKLDAAGDSFLQNRIEASMQGSLESTKASLRMVAANDADDFCIHGKTNARSEYQIIT